MRGLPLLCCAAAVVTFTGCTWQSKYDALQEENQKQQQQIAADQQQIAADKARISRLQGAIKYTVNSDLLFPSGSWQMSDDGKDIIAKMAKTLAADQENKLIVNGYTDNAPVGPRLVRQGVTSNQILSQKRAEAVMQYMISQGVKPNLVSAVGHGETDPVAPNTTPQGRAQNRRVEITLAESSS